MKGSENEEGDPRISMLDKEESHAKSQIRQELRLALRLGAFARDSHAIRGYFCPSRVRRKNILVKLSEKAGRRSRCMGQG